MTDYKTIKGGLVKAVSSDPSNPYVGEVWFNSTTNLLKVRSFAGAWSTGGTVSTAREYGAGCGTQTAALLAGGYRYSPNTGVADSEEYNGTGWTEGDELSTAGYKRGGLGTQTAAVVGPGHSTGPVVASTEEYDGTTWSNVGDANSARDEAHGFGTQTAGCISGGTPYTASTEEYNGTGWTAAEDANSSVAGRGAAGTQIAGLMMGGQPLTTNTEEYDGTDWAEAGELSTGRVSQCGIGLQTAALCCGGNTPSVSALVEEYDGSSFSDQTALPAVTGQNTADGAGTTTAGLVMSGAADGLGGVTTACPEWDQGNVTHTVSHS